MFNVYGTWLVRLWTREYGLEDLDDHGGDVGDGGWTRVGRERERYGEIC